MADLSRETVSVDDRPTPLGERLLPAWGWLRGYRREDLPGDLTAGLTTGFMLVPQAMAYALLAGLPPSVGLYASTFPLVAYALFGSSRQLAVGPVAMISLLVASGVAELASPGTDDYVQYAALLALMVGLVQLVFGLIRLGFITNFISHAVITGFTSAAAIVILLSQVKHLLGVKIEPTESTPRLVAELWGQLPQTHWLALLVGATSITVLAVLRKSYPRFPAAMLVVLTATLLTWGLNLGRHGLPIVGEVPAGLPPLALPNLDPVAFQKLAVAALTILFVGYLESVSIAQMIAARERYRINPDQELVALGLANVVAGLFSGYPVTGGFSRTAVNYQAGARTGLAALVTAALVVLTILLLTPLFRHLPQAALAAVVVTAVLGLIDVRGMRQLFRLKPADGWVATVTFATTLGVGVEAGILTGVALSLLQFIWRSSHPHIAELGYVPAEGAYLNIRRFPEAIQHPEVLILRIDAALYFANMGFVETRLRQCLAERPETKWVVLDLSGVNDIDASAVHALRELITSHRERGITFVFAGMKGPVRDVIARAGWDAATGYWQECHSVRDALDRIGLPPAADS